MLYTGTTEGGEWVAPQIDLTIWGREHGISWSLRLSTAFCTASFLAWVMAQGVAWHFPGI